MSAPRKIWVDDVSAAYPNIAFVDNGSEDVYHHDDVVRELVEALERIGWHELTDHEARDVARAALAKIAQDGQR